MSPQNTQQPVTGSIDDHQSSQPTISTLQERQYSCDYLFEQEEPPVEYRLLQFNEIYKMKKEEAVN